MADDPLTSPKLTAERVAQAARDKEISDKEIADANERDRRAGARRAAVAGASDAPARVMRDTFVAKIADTITDIENEVTRADEVLPPGHVVKNRLVKILALAKSINDDVAQANMNALRSPSPSETVADRDARLRREGA